MSAGPFQNILPLTLASASPRRRDFLRLLGLDFAVVRPDNKEPLPLAGEEPAHHALRAAEAKARAAVAARPGSCANALVIGADTVVVTPEGEILGKPEDPEHALSMLRRLAGKTHEVISACFCLLPNGETRQATAGARVRFFPWDEETLAAYVRTGETADKAGAYAVQGKGAFLVERIDGSVSAVVGLPLAELVRLLLGAGAIRPNPRRPANSIP
jgi:septum formation protein